MALIAFIGLGNMGGGMCANLCKAGHDVRAFDLSRSAVDKAVEDGAVGAGSVRSAVAGADVVITMLPAGEHVRDVYLGKGGVAESVSGDPLMIDCSTIAVEHAREISEALEARGFTMVDAPVSGGTPAADAGTLTIMVGGSQEGFERAHQILECMGRNIFHAGGPGNGQAAKISNNLLLGISMIGTSEAFNLAERLGLDAQTFFDISSRASGQCWSMTSYCPAPGPVPAAPSNSDYEPGFAVAMMLKDLRLAHEAAADADAVTPLGDQALRIYAQLSEDGHSGLDFSGVMKRITGKI